MTHFPCQRSLLNSFSVRRNHSSPVPMASDDSQSALTFLGTGGSGSVPSIILSHDHADAVLGLDDIRSVQPYSPTNDVDPAPIYLTQFTMESVAMKFPYLVHKEVKEGQEVRRVAKFEWRIIDDNCEKSFVASGLQFVPLPVLHGKGYICLGFLFGEKGRVAY